MPPPLLFPVNRRQDARIGILLEAGFCARSKVEHHGTPLSCLSCLSCLSGAAFKLHDFGFRGVSSVESAAMGGLGLAPQTLVDLSNAQHVSVFLLSCHVMRFLGHRVGHHIMRPPGEFHGHRHGRVAVGSREILRCQASGGLFDPGLRALHHHLLGCGYPGSNGNRMKRTPFSLQP